MADIHVTNVLQSLVTKSYIFVIIKYLLDISSGSAVRLKPYSPHIHMYTYALT
jgi:hypothetical protein